MKLGVEYFFMKNINSSTILIDSYENQQKLLLEIENFFGENKFKMINMETLYADNHSRMIGIKVFYEILEQPHIRDLIVFD